MVINVPNIMGTNIFKNSPEETQVLKNQGQKNIPADDDDTTNFMGIEETLINVGGGNTSSATYVQIVEITVASNQDNIPLAFSWTHDIDGGASKVFTRIYINDIAVGIEQNTVGSLPVDVAETITGINDKDKVQLYMYSVSGSGNVNCDNFTVKIINIYQKPTLTDTS